jgi:hypothetical protein
MSLRNFIACRDCLPTKADAIYCVAGFACFFFLAWAVALPHSWNGG